MTLISSTRKFLAGRCESHVIPTACLKVRGSCLECAHWCSNEWLDLGGSLVQTALCASCQMLQVAAGFQQNCFPDEVKYLYKCFVELMLSVQRSDCPLNMILFLTRGEIFPGNFIFSEIMNSTGKKQVSMWSTAVLKHIVFWRLQGICASASSGMHSQWPLQWEVLSLKLQLLFSTLFPPEKNKIKISKARITCSWAQTACCALSKLKFKEKLWRTWEPKVIWSYSKSQSRLLLHEAEWKMY